MTDQELLADFVSGSDGAFEALVRRHAGMVFGAALRVTRSRELAEDAAQLVFAIMLRKASALAKHPKLAAWLHKSSTLEASRLMRKERNHQRKLNRFGASSAAASEGDAPPDHRALEHLDEAMAALRSDDRQFLLLRFYQGYKLREIASELGKSEAAVRKQSERAIARLSKLLRDRGVELPAAALGGVLSGAFVEPAGAGLVTAITSEAAAASASLSSGTIIINTLQTMSSGKQIALTATAVALLAAIPVGIQTQKLDQARGELEQARTRVEPDSAPASTASATPALAAAPALPTVEPNSLRAQAAASGSADAQFLRALLTREIRPPAEQIAAFIGEERSLAELRSMFDEVVDLPLSDVQRSTIRKLIREIGRQDGKGAIALAMEAIDSPALRHHALGAAYAGWAGHDPEAAWAYVQTLPPELKATHPYWQIMHGAAQGELGAGAFYSFVEAHSGDLLKLGAGQLWNAMAHVYDHKDSQGMATWIQSLPDGSLKDMSSSQLVQRMALTDPVAAREWMAANLDIRENTEAVKQLANGWAQVDPPAAMDWITSLPQELQTEELYRNSLEWWLRFDQVGAAEWLAEAEPSALLDRPFESYVYRVRGANPSEAMTWAMAITNTERSQHMMREVAKTWRRQDAEALAEFIASEPAAAAAGLR